MNRKWFYVFGGLAFLVVLGAVVATSMRDSRARNPQNGRPTVASENATSKPKPKATVLTATAGDSLPDQSLMATQQSGESPTRLTTDHEHVNAPTSVPTLSFMPKRPNFELSEPWQDNPVDSVVGNGAKLLGEFDNWTEPRATEVAAEGDVNAHQVHVVRQGETLRYIAAMRLGSDTRWRDIVRLNPGILRASEGPLKPGQQLLLPSDAGPVHTAVRPADAAQQ